MATKANSLQLIFDEARILPRGAARIPRGREDKLHALVTRIRTARRRALTDWRAQIEIGRETGARC